MGLEFTGGIVPHRIATFFKNGLTGTRVLEKSVFPLSKGKPLSGQWAS
jgi:hypothetical protein